MIPLVNTNLDISQNSCQGSFVFLDDVDEFSEDAEFELEFDAIHEPLDCLFENV